MIRAFLIGCAIVALAQAQGHTHSHGQQKSRPIRLTELENYVRQMDATDGFTAEFKSLPEPSTQMRPWTTAQLPQNIPKHRYPTPEDNLLTYDETRVVLYRNQGDYYSDFIMANWVDSYKDRRRYIGTQCPMESTASDFFRMVWQYNVHEIVMLASEHDIEKGKCFRYFPENSTTYGEIEVKLERKQMFPDMVVRIYSIKRGGSSRVLVHHHFTGWPDMGVPNDPQQLLNVIRKYRNSDTYTRAWPVVVHCVGGVGRTGTFLLSDSMYDMASNEDHVDLLKHFWTIRNQRISMIEKPEQYGLAHKVILEAYKQGLFEKKDTNRVQELQFNPTDVSTGGQHNTMGGGDGGRKKMNLLIVDPKMADHDIVIRVTADQDRCTATGA